MGERPWYADFFDDDYLRIFASELLAERTAAEVNGAVELLGLPRGRLLGSNDGGPLDLDSSFLVPFSGRRGGGIS